MGEWREIARRAHGTLGGHDGVDAAPEQVADTVRQHRPTARVAQRQRVCPQQEHCPNYVPRQRLAHTHRVGDQQVLLKPRRVGRIDQSRGQIAESGGHPIDDLARRDKALHYLPSLGHARSRLIAQTHVYTATGYGLDVGDRDIRAREDDFGVGLAPRPRALGGGLMVVGRNA
jgi:hypothetical protein